MPNWTAEDLASHMARMLRTGGRELAAGLDALTGDEAKALAAQGKATGRLPVPKGMNKTEESYSHRLTELCMAGDVIWFGFEALKVRIGRNCWLTPDFLVMYLDRHLELHDTKGRKGKTYYAEDDAIVKARAVGADFPIPIYFVFRERNGEWAKREM